MPREPTYGELAYHTLNRLLEIKHDDWDERPAEIQSAFENMAAAVLAYYHKRQIALSRQTQPEASPWK